MGEQPLAGFTVGVTAARRHEELSALLERRGAKIVRAPAIRLLPLADDADLLDATRKTLGGSVDDVVVTTGVGFRAWLEAAEAWGLRDALVGHLRAARVITRGPKARGAVRAAGITEAWSAELHSCEDIADRLRTEDLTGRRIAVQLYGEPVPQLTGPLREAGAEVVEVPVYRWARPDDPAPLRRLVGQAIAGAVDAITFTSAPAVAATLSAAADDGLEEPLLHALRVRVVAACVGSVTAAPLDDRGVPTVRPERSTLGGLVRALAAELPSRHAATVTVRGHELELRGHAAVLDGLLRPIPRASMAILRALAQRPGHVISRAELCEVLPGRSLPASRTRPRADEHAVEMAITRLRRGLGEDGLVETVVKRGYRLACEPARPIRPGTDTAPGA